jgi:hypothetical protein
VRIIAACTLALAVAGCAAYQQRQLEQAQAQAAAQAASDDAQCQSYGAIPGSPVYVQCRMNLTIRERRSPQMTAPLLSNTC